MSKNTRLVLGCGATILIVAAVIVGIVAFYGYKSYRLYKDNDDAGRVFGATVDQEGCLTEGLRRGRTISRDENGRFANGTFVQGCLEASKPVDNFCEGVPAVYDKAAQTKWVKSECQKAGQSDNPGCTQGYNEKHTYCGFPTPKR